MRALSLCEIDQVSGGLDESQDLLFGHDQNSGNGRGSGVSFDDVLFLNMFATPTSRYSGWAAGGGYPITLPDGSRVTLWDGVNAGSQHTSAAGTVPLHGGPSNGGTGTPGSHWQYYDTATHTYYHYDGTGNYINDGASPATNARDVTIGGIIVTLSSNIYNWLPTQQQVAGSVQNVLMNNAYFSAGYTTPIGIGGGVAYSYNTGLVLHGGVGYPGVSVQVGLAADTSGYLTGNSWSQGGIIGIGGWDGPTAVFIGTPQVGYSYGVRASDVVNYVGSQFSTFSQQFSDAVYYRVGQPFSDSIYNRMGRPYDPPAEPQH